MISKKKKKKKICVGIQKTPLQKTYEMSYDKHMTLYDSYKVELESFT